MIYGIKNINSSILHLNVPMELCKYRNCAMISLAHLFMNRFS